MLEFLKDYWNLIFDAFCVVLFIVSVVIAFIRKRKNKLNFLDSVKEALLENLPTWIILSENLKEGKDKKNNVISLGVAFATKLVGRELSPDETSYLVAFIENGLESILSTPQKKLETAEKQEEKTNGYRITK